MTASEKISKNKQKRLMIIDGNALIHRSWHALPPLTTKSGVLVNAVYGFTAVLLKAIREFKPAYVALTLDRKEKTFRHKAYEDYKANRVKAPQELYAQIPRVKEVAQALNIPIYEKAGFEADDLIGTIVSSVDGGVEKIIVTGDLDTLQLVNRQTKVFTMKRGLTDSQIYDENVVKQRYGLAPEQMIDFKALRGDPSDNIAGVRGIGEKTAIELLKEFKTLDGVYKHIESKKIKDRIRELLKEQKNNAYLSYKLATIKCDVDMQFKLEDARFDNFNQEAAAKIFNKYEFKSLLPRLQSIFGEIKRVKTKTNQAEVKEIINDKFKRNLKNFNYQLIDDDKRFNKFFKKISGQKEFTFDTETGNFDPVTAELLGISFCWEKGEAYYVNVKAPISPPKADPRLTASLAMAGTAPLAENVKANNLFDYQKVEQNQKGLHPWLERLKPIFEDEKIKKYGHNIKYDLEVMASLGVNVRGVAADSMIMSYLLNPGTRQHNLDGLTFSEFNHQKITKEDLLGKGRDKIEFKLVPLEKLYNYSCEDADFTFRLVKKFEPQLKREKLIKLFEEIEMPLVEVLVRMEINGIKIDKQCLLKLSQEVNKKIKVLEKKIYGMAGKEFNINSTQQLREILFEKLGIPTLGIAKTKTGLSTGADELAKLKDQHPIIKFIQDYRELMKLATTYIDALPKLVNPKTGRLHTSFNQSVTATGRLSSTEPNLQNIPVRTELGQKIRRAFIADQGNKLLSLDYSQIELRLAAHMSGDKKLIKAFLLGEDIHRATAAEINGVRLDQVTPEMRREAKAVNFGILYGQGPHGLSTGAGIPYVRAKGFIDNYFKVYKDVKKFIDETIAKARAKGYTQTLFGRRRYLPEINSSALQVMKAAERMAINTPLQGTAADIIKIAMIRIQEIINKDYKNTELKMLLQVHDELLFEVREDLVEEVAGKTKKIMEQVIKLKVPIIAEASFGDNWEEMEEVK